MEILVAEDNASTLALMNKILEKSGHKILLANDGNKAWEIFLKNHTRIVISDWEMPGLDGIELCRRIRSDSEDQYTYIILVTAKENTLDLTMAFEMGVDDYLTKPINRQGLLARIRAGERIIQLEEKNRKINLQLLQSEKMASVGQLAAGVAHEINNPTGFVSSNLTTLSNYQDDIISLVGEYRRLVEDLKVTIAGETAPDPIKDHMKKIKALESEIDIGFVMDDIRDIIKESKEGIDRIKKIVIDLKDFAHPGDDELKTVDITKCLESTLNVVWNEIKYKAKVIKNYAHLPLVEGYPQQLNQVFMNVLVNAAQAITDKGEITISTQHNADSVVVMIRDNGIGIPEENLAKIFDPFFTTKPVGSGTGLGMNVAYNIIKKHNGTIGVESQVGKGTTFTIRIPVNQVLPIDKNDGENLTVQRANP